MKRILVFGMTENPGGVESFLLNYYRHIDREKIQFDFLCNTHQPIAYEDELKRSGADIYRITPRKENWRQFAVEVKNLLRENNRWDAIWVNVNNLANIDYLIYAKRAGIRKRIIHSHNSFDTNGAIRRIFHEINKRRIRRYATDFWACSEAAAKWFYTQSVQSKAVIVHNAIDTDSKRFNPYKREQIRKQYHWNDCFVIGNIGRLHYQKNQEFLIDVFYKYQTQNPQSRLVIIGQGEEEDHLKKRTEELRIADKVFFAGVQEDIQAWLSSFDLFCFPSRFEGFGIVTLEAEVNGLPIVASDSGVPEELRINPNLRILSLSARREEWANQIEELRRSEREQYDDIKARVLKGGYDICNEAKRLEKLLG